MDVSPAKRSYFTCANVWWKLLFHSTHEIHGFSTVLFHIFDNAPASYPDLISVLPDGQAVRLHFPAIVIQKQYIQKSLSSHCHGNAVILRSDCFEQRLKFFSFCSVWHNYRALAGRIDQFIFIAHFLYIKLFAGLSDFTPTLYA